jgi:hypothetical protein
LDPDVFALKKDAFGKVVRYKARLVAKGYAQTFGLDYSETYAPVVDATIYRYLLALAAQYGLKVETMDVVTFFLYGDLDRDLYMDVPGGLPRGRTVDEEQASDNATEGAKWSSAIRKDVVQ